MGARDFLAELSCAGLSVRLEGDRLIVGPSLLLSAELRDAIRVQKAGLVELLGRQSRTVAPDDSRRSEGEFSDSIKVLRAAGLDDGRANSLARWMLHRRAEGDDRRLCIECLHFAANGRICNHRDRMAIQSPRDLGGMATTPQRCSGFTEARAREAINSHKTRPDDAAAEGGRTSLGSRVRLEGRR